MSFLPFSRPAIGDEEIAAVTQVLKSGWITTGPKNQELEQLFCQTFGCKHAIAVSSATAGMHVTLMALNIGPGDEVITPSQTWVSTINLITLLGATPVFVDIDRDTLMTDATRIAKAITPRTKAIIPVQETASNVDSVAMVGGLITIFSPIFLMSGGAHDKEISILKGEALAIEQSAKDKRCESIIKWFEKEKMTPKIT